VADEGGGVPRSDLRLLWTFFYTTFPPSIPSSPAPLAAGGAGGGSLDENVTVTVRKGGREGGRRGGEGVIALVDSSLKTKKGGRREGGRKGGRDKNSFLSLSHSMNNMKHKQNAAGGAASSPFTFPNVGTEPVLAGHGKRREGGREGGREGRVRKIYQQSFICSVPIH